jgi:uncharacterized protein (TIGR02145 family)
MKKALNLIVLVGFLAGIAVLHSCKKEPDMPTLTTTAISSITTTSASSGGNITDDGGAEVTARGVCWGTAANPTVSGSKTNDGTGIGSFTSSISGLTENTLYYVRAYATNSAGTAYGNEVSFTTEQIVGATITTTDPSAVTSTSATSGGNITSDGGASITERGICWATTANPTTASNKVASGTGTGTFTANITGLQPGTLYHVRAYAINSFGPAYGADKSFTTLAIAPTVTTAAVTIFTQTTATAGGEVTSTGGADVTERGVYFGTAADPVTSGTKAAAAAGGAGVFTCSLTGLTPGTLYHVVAFATNSVDTDYGDEVTFTTSPVIKATLTTTAPVLIPTSSTSVTGGGNVTANGGGTVDERGVCWSTSTAPAVDDAADFHLAAGTAGLGVFEVTMAGLSEGTVYYVRAYAHNSAGYAYGNEFQILTMMSDGEDNIYKTVRIGTQIWMAENLKVTQLSDVAETPIQNVETDGTWIGLASAAYCWYNNNEATYKPLYGALYNWFAVNTGDLCPTGWRVPSDADFKTLEMQLGMTQAQADGTSWRGTNQGIQLKSTTLWTSGAGTNTSGFTALPGGFRYYDDGAFLGAGTIAYFWSTTADNADRSFMRQLDSTHDGVERANADNNAGKSVRCIKE